MLQLKEQIEQKSNLSYFSHPIVLKINYFNVFKLAKIFLELKKYSNFKTFYTFKKFISLYLFIKKVIIIMM